MLAVCLLWLLSLQAASAGPIEDADVAIERHEFTSALAILRPLAAQGLPEAQLRIGNLYSAGQGVQRNGNEALKWYLKAAKQGYGPAELALALNYFLGRIVERNSTEAVKWARLAAAHGDVVAEGMLGYAYDTGDGVAKDDMEGTKWDQMAAQHGDPSAQMRLAQRYRDGRGVKMDLVDSYMWFSIATEKIGADAVRSRDEVAKKMTSEQISEAQQLVRSWRPEEP